MLLQDGLELNYRNMDANDSMIIQDGPELKRKIEKPQAAQVTQGFM
jgi:hypothetical protein